MAVVDASATADATSLASSDAAVVVSCALTFGGDSAVAGSAGLGQLAGGTFRGRSSFQHEIVPPVASATFAGTASASATGSVRVQAKALVRGSSRLSCSVPLAAVGTSSVSAVPVVDRRLRPLRGITLGPKTFRWLQPLQRGDLPVLICDRHAPFGPHRVTYSLLQLRSDGSCHYVGARDRVPAAGDVGEFYATGRAGESGQPGQWAIEWRFQRSPGAAPETAEMRFQVLDAVGVADARDYLPRKKKLGWL